MTFKKVSLSFSHFLPPIPAQGGRVTVVTRLINVLLSKFSTALSAWLSTPPFLGTPGFGMTQTLLEMGMPRFEMRQTLLEMGMPGFGMRQTLLETGTAKLGLRQTLLEMVMPGLGIRLSYGNR